MTSAMGEKPAEPGDAGSEQDVRLTADDLEAALDLLAAERPPPRGLILALALTLLSFVSFGTLFAFLPLGLIVIWFDRTWGKSLLAVAGVSLVLMAATASRSTMTKTAELKTTLATSNVGKAAVDLWEHRRARSSSVSSVLALVAMLALLVGSVLLGIGLIRSGEVSVLSIGLIVLGILGFWVPVAQTEYRQFRYFSDIAEVRARLETLGDRTASAGPVVVSPQDFRIISAAERHQAVRKAAKTIEALPESEHPTYGIVILPAAATALANLAVDHPDSWQSIRGGIDSLQADPDPSGAQPVAGSTDRLRQLERGGRLLMYRLNEDERRIEILDLRERVSP